MLSLCALSQMKIASKKMLSVGEVLSQLFDSESGLEEHVRDTEEDPDYDASSSEENETLSADAPLVAQPKMESFYGPTSTTG